MARDPSVSEARTGIGEAYGFRGGRGARITRETETESLAGDERWSGEKGGAGDPVSYRRQ